MPPPLGLPCGSKRILMIRQKQHVLPDTHLPLNPARLHHVLPNSPEREEGQFPSVATVAEVEHMRRAETLPDPLPNSLGGVSLDASTVSVFGVPRHDALQAEGNSPRILSRLPRVSGRFDPSEPAR